jgi:pimeloyl-ACP methyl ester carboxylesterase
MGAKSTTSPTRAVTISAGSAQLAADLTAPEGATGVVAFAHGSGSGRHSPRNREVAKRLNDACLATLLLDLLTEREESVDRRTGELRFDIPLLARRMVAAIDWLESEPALARLSVGCFGASTGAAAALIAAARRPERVLAVVSRGGRPDLAGAQLASVAAPTLLIVGRADPVVLELNRQAQRHLPGETSLEIVEHAGHLFEEPEALARVAELARAWFLSHLNGRSLA